MARKADGIVLPEQDARRWAATAAKVRGLCPTCRSAVWWAVVSGSASEEELIARGLLLPAKTPGRPAKSGFARQLAQLKR